MATRTQALIDQAIALREESLANIKPQLQLDRIPNPLPSNVTKVPSSVLTQEELEITSYEPEDLLKVIKTKKYSCVAVTKAFLRRAALAQALVNCVTELLPDFALERAAYLDSLDSPVGPLHGLPISVKEHHGMFGRMKTCGYVAYIDDDHSGVSAVNDVMWEAGAIFYVRTTMPQTGMHLETSSNIYGVTLNPYNLSLSAGGSSGGESAILALRGSVLGIGGDSGGSIRGPAANTGVYGFKPTTGRVSRRGAKTVSGGDGIIGSHGPMSTSRLGLSIFMETYLHYEPWIKDPALVPLPWREPKLPSRLKIGIMWNDGIVIPHPPVQRALREVSTALKRCDNRFDVVDWATFGQERCAQISMSLYFEDGGRAIRKVIDAGGESARHLTDWALNHEHVRYRTVEEVWDLKAQRNAYRQEFNDHWLRTGAADGHPVDAILCPVAPGAAPPHETGKYWCYTSQWNLLEYPSVSFPVTAVDQKLDVKVVNYEPQNEQDGVNHRLYEPSRYVDAPVGLQLVTRKFEDEKCLAILEEIEKAIGKTRMVLFKRD